MPSKAEQLRTQRVVNRLAVLAFFCMALVVNGAEAATDSLGWLLGPIDPNRPHSVGFFEAWHGRFMVLAWGFLFPVGVIAARFFKVVPWQNWPNEVDNQTWWRAHRTLQYLGGGLVLAAVGLALQIEGDDPQGTLHRWLGWSVAALLAAQFLSAWLRGSTGGPAEPGADGSLAGDHYNMTTRRLAFEVVHKLVGYIALVAAAATVVSGLYLANAPVWMWLCSAMWWLVLIAAAAFLQMRGFTIDTYQAIWGPSLDHPGNRRPPIGIGIRRVADREHRDG